VSPTGAPRPAVSVAMLVYGHEAFVGEAIESVLAQSFDDWELVIAEDRSPDKSYEIAAEYAAQHPDRIRLLPRPEENLGGRRNFARLLQACRGTFLSQLDGDDYFTDPARLAVMTEVLESDPDLAWAFHGVEQVDEHGRPNGTRITGDPNARYDRFDLLRKCPAASAGVLHRRPERFDLPQYFWDSPVGDWALHMMLTGERAFAYVDRMMAVHRVHGGGIWSQAGAQGHLDIRARGRRAIMNAFDEPPVAFVESMEFVDRFDLGRVLEREGDSKGALEVYAWCRANLDRAPEGFPKGRLRRRWLRARVRSLMGGTRSLSGA